MEMAEAVYQGFVSIYREDGSRITDSDDAWADLRVLPEIETWVGELSLLAEMIPEDLQGQPLPDPNLNRRSLS